jgi:hypothetical protein
VNITRAKLVKKLLELRGATFVTVTVTTDSRCKKTGNPYGKVLKTVTVNCQVNFHYDRAVITQLEKEGKDESEFEKGESWHEPYKVDGKLTPLALKKGETVPGYLRVRHLLTVGEPIYTQAVGGSEVAVALVRPFLPARSTYSNQGADDPIRFLTYSLESVRFIRLSGEEYFVV